MNVWTALFSVLSFIAVAAPFLLGRDRGGDAVPFPDPAAAERVRQIRWAMEELDLDAASGKINDADRDALREELEGEMKEALVGLVPSSEGGGGGGISRG